VSRINVLVSTATHPLYAEIIAATVADRSDMVLVEGRWVGLTELPSILESMPPTTRCALVLVGRSPDSNELADRLLTELNSLVVLYVDVIDEMVRIKLRDPLLSSLLTALHELVESVDTEKQERVARIELSGADSVSENEVNNSGTHNHRHPLLQASINWVHALLLNAVETHPNSGETVSSSAIVGPESEPLSVTHDLNPDNRRAELPEDEELRIEFKKATNGAEPLAAAIGVFGLKFLEFRMMLLGLAPELDVRYPQCIGFLLDGSGRRIGTMGLYCSLLGISPQVRGERILGGILAGWRVFERPGGSTAAAEEPLRLDPFLAQWLLGDSAALENDPHVRRALRLVPWPGAGLLDQPEGIAHAVELIDELQDPDKTEWLVLGGDDLPAWRALIELGATKAKATPIRVDVMRLAKEDVLGIEESARRIGRMARLNGDPLIIDIPKMDGGETEANGLRLFFRALRCTGSKPAIICREKAHIVSFLGSTPYKVIEESPLPMTARVAAMRAAATKAGAFVTSEFAATLIARYPLYIDSLENAMTLALSSRTGNSFLSSDSALDVFTTALKEFAAEEISNLVERSEPAFTLEQVVLPDDRKEQLVEIVDQVRLAREVLDDWKFREQLPYGRGVTALFFGSSGTGKTMAAIGIAHRLSRQVLRLDLSRVVSKYIGETEKNLDRVFTDAQRSGAIILIDEADALFGKRSEIKEARDRYANMEVAYLLQRMEAYEGLAILTTNMKKNLDPAFMRRLRFIIEFPRPNAIAREAIWRQCLPGKAHKLSDEEFRQIARRVEFTGGQIRQTTLRAAFMAAAAKQQIHFEHIVKATLAELTKLGLPPVDLDLNRIRRAA
jgi:AAA+ superfamily predicted ATPase